MYSERSHAAVALIVIDVFILPSGMPGEQCAHIAEMAHRHADLANLAARERVVAVVSGLGRQVEGDRKARLPLARFCDKARLTLSRSNGPHRCGRSRACRA